MHKDAVITQIAVGMLIGCNTIHHTAPSSDQALWYLPHLQFITRRGKTKDEVKTLTAFVQYKN